MIATTGRQRLFRFACGVVAVLWLLAGAAHAQVTAAVTESALKAAFLIKFPTFVEWPPGTFTRPDQPLVIGVVGDEAVAAQLEQLSAGRTVETYPVVVRRIADGAAASGVHVLYLGARRAQALHDALEATQTPVLTVTSLPGTMPPGSVLNFVTDAGRVRFTASLVAAEARRLKLSSRLLAVALSVDGRAR